MKKLYFHRNRFYFFTSINIVIYLLPSNIMYYMYFIIAIKYLLANCIKVLLLYKTIPYEYLLIIFLYFV